MKKTGKVLLTIFASIFGIILLGIAIFAFTFRNELSAISSIKLIKAPQRDLLQGGVYEMTFKGNYYFEDFIKSGGAKTDRELSDFVSRKITKGLVKMNLNTGKIGCSVFTAKTASGQRIFARNFDYPAANTCIVKIKGNKKRHSSISTVNLTFFGIPFDKDVDTFASKIFCLMAPYCPLDGINDAGVSFGVLESNQGPGNGSISTNQNTELPDITTGAFMRMILDYADSIEDAVEIAQKYDMHDSNRASFHYMVTDKSGRSAILEWVNEIDKTDIQGNKRKLVVTYNDDDLVIGPKEAGSDFQWLTNFIIQPGYYEGTEESFIGGRDRYDIIYDKLGPSNGIVKDEMEAMEILHSVASRTLYPKRTKINKHLTVYSIIFNLDEGSLLWCPAEQFQDQEGMLHYKLKLHNIQ